MAKEKMVKSITSRDEDFAQWYTDVVKKAGLTDYSSVRGCMVIKPAGYAIWELIQSDLDRRFKAVSYTHLEDHINTDLYEEALSEAKDAYGDEAPDFYDAQQKFFEENDK